MAPSDAQTVLVVLAHPDDPDFFCGGTIGLWTSQGRKVVYCLLTRGDKGSDDPKADPQALMSRRTEEQLAAADVLGVSEVKFLDYRDGEIRPSEELCLDITRMIRQVKPDILVTCDPTNFYPNRRRLNHSDHRAVGEAALDAVFPAARSGMYFPQLLEEGLAAHKVEHVYITGAAQPDLNVDITSQFDKKIKAIGCHVSQVGDDLAALRDRLKTYFLDPESPPDEPRYIERFRYMNLS
jgi:LmbE family N-acetylglucosaminyl deacetylase